MNAELGPVRGRQLNICFKIIFHAYYNNFGAEAFSADGAR
jgi:hypothetical protein